MAVADCARKAAVGCFHFCAWPHLSRGSERFWRNRGGYRPDVLATRGKGSAVAEVQESVEVNVPLQTQDSAASSADRAKEREREMEESGEENAA
jgi:hypothetical protein